MSHWRSAECLPDTPVRVGFAGYVLQFPYRGVGRYARLIMEQLLAADDLRPILIGGEWTARPGVPELLTSIHNPQCPPGSRQRSFATVHAPRPLRHLAEKAPGRAYEIGQRMFWEQIGLQFAARRLRLDVLYSPYHALPLFPPRRSIVTIHDLIPLSVPAYRGSTLAFAYFRLACAAARQAAAVVTDSAFSKREIIHLLRIPEGRIHVVPLGVEARFSPAPDPRAANRARERLGLPERYLLYLGGSDARKNIGVLLQALALLRDDRVEGGPLPPLVISAATQDAGSTPWHPDWRAQARTLGLEREIVWLDRVAEEDLPAVYRGALAFCFPSRVEGFGLTPLEAMACGAPVLCSDSSSLPEVVGEAGLLLPPDDPAAWARAMAAVCRDEALRARLRAAGPARAAAFSWERTGRAVLDVIRMVARQGRPS